MTIRDSQYEVSVFKRKITYRVSRMAFHVLLTINYQLPYFLPKKYPISSESSESNPARKTLEFRIRSCGFQLR